MINPCPFCGSNDTIIRTIDTEDREGVPVALTCMECGAQGPWAYVSKDLTGCKESVCEITKWNERKSKLCTCNQLKPGLQDIDERLRLAELHHAGPYTQTPFVFCPWCGDRICAEVKMHPDVISATVECNQKILWMSKEEMEKEFCASEESQKGEE